MAAGQPHAGLQPVERGVMNTRMSHYAIAIANPDGLRDLLAD